MANTLTIDASAMNGVNLTTWINEYFAQFTTASTAFYGGTPDSAYGGTYYMNGSQVLATLNELVDDTATPTDSGVLIEGSDIAYDFMHYGSSYGHGISGSIDSLTFGTWVDGTTTGTRGIGAEGEITGYDASLIIDGFGVSAAAGAGTDTTTNATYEIYSAIRNLDANALEAVIGRYALEVYGSSGDDTIDGSVFADVLIGGAGNDTLLNSPGADLMLGGMGRDTILGGYGADTLHGGAGADLIIGHQGADVIYGGAGADTLRGGMGMDTITGGAGADTFVIVKVSALDTITDFKVGTDVLDVSALGVDSLSDFTIRTNDSGVLLRLDTVRIQLDGVSAAELTNDIFVF